MAFLFLYWNIYRYVAVFVGHSLYTVYLHSGVAQSTFAGYIPQAEVYVAIDRCIAVNIYCILGCQQYGGIDIVEILAFYLEINLRANESRWYVLEQCAGGNILYRICLCFVVECNG